MRGLAGTRDRLDAWIAGGLAVAYTKLHARHTSGATLRVSPETRDTINEIAREDYGGVTVDEALGRLAREHRRALWVEEARLLREQQPEQWDAAGAES